MASQTVLNVGDIFELREDHMCYYGKNGRAIKVGGLAGEYKVVKTAFDGGGTGHGPHDVYPDGHHVWAESTHDHLIAVHFYQSGCFTAQNEDIVAKTKAGYTHKVTFVKNHKMFGRVESTFNTTDDAVELHRASLKEKVAKGKIISFKIEGI